MKKNIPSITLLGQDLSQEILVTYNEGLELKRYGQYEAAIAIFKQTIEVAPDFMFPYFVLGQCYVDLQAWEEVIPCFERVNEMVEDEGDAHFFIGCAHYHLKQYEQAIAAFEMALKVGLKDNQPPNVYYYWAMAEKMRVMYDQTLPFLGKWDNALAAIDKALALSPNATYYLEKANILVAIQAYPSALEMYEELYEQAGFTHEIGIRAALGMATCYSLLHDYKKCMQLLKKILKVVPEIKAQMAKDSAFNNLRNSSEYAKKFEALLT